MNRVTEILFHEVADLSAADRHAYFQQHTIPAEIRAEVEALLQFDQGGDHLLTASIAGSAEALLDRTGELKESGRCGPYRLLRVLGRGGMGAVYLAERADGEVEQRVAIKFLRYADEERAIRDRFLRERQILAALNHPGIARLLDAGHTSTGQPYLVMDYIDGTPIDAYAEKLDLRGKLGLFLRVCDALSYAHRNLIIHRDIKPSNILVDASGQPKLLDFGIAKILDAPTDQTRTMERLMTPEFASPEQVRGAAQATTSDIYSLGAVLFKLLTGNSPYSLNSGSGVSIDAAICLTEPPAPSRLNSSLPKDLDFIVLKALRKEPEERYGSADAFADDIRALLESRPVKARSGSAWYRSRKFLRRYWAPVAAAAVVITSLSAGLYVANRERAMAQRRFLQVRQLANKVLALDGVIRVLPGSTRARTEIIAMSQEYLKALESEAPKDQDLALELANAYFVLAGAQGIPTSPNLGQYAEAELSLRKAEALLEPILKRSSGNRKALILSADIAQGLMILTSTARRRDEALLQARKAAANVENLLALQNPSPAETTRAFLILNNIALAHKNLHLYQDAIRYARRAIEISPTVPPASALVSNPMSVVADSLRLSGDLNGALEIIEQARSHAEREGSVGETSRRSNLFNVLWREGAILGQEDSISLGRPEDAIEVFQHSMDLTEEWAQRDPGDSSSRILLATAVREMGKILAYRDPRRALAIYDKGIERLSEVKNNTHARRGEAVLEAGSSYPLRKLHRIREAKERLDTAFRILRETKDYPVDRLDPNQETAFVLRAWGDQFAETGQPERAAVLYRELIDKMMAFKPDAQNDLLHATKLSQAWEALAAIDRRIGSAGEAAALDSQRLGIWKHWENKLPNNPFILRQIAAVHASEDSSAHLLAKPSLAQAQLAADHVHGHR